MAIAKTSPLVCDRPIEPKPLDSRSECKKNNTATNCNACRVPLVRFGDTPVCQQGALLIERAHTGARRRPLVNKNMHETLLNAQIRHTFHSIAFLRHGNFFYRDRSNVWICVP